MQMIWPCCFNPRPSFLTGESLLIVGGVFWRAVFQSTPVISDGRIFIHRRKPDTSGLFQSTPVISDGRISRFSTAPTRRSRFQSTPVISDGRIQLGRARDGTSEWFQSTPVISDGRISSRRCAGRRRGCFNPRPSFLTGESFTIKSTELLIRVSIHARHF